MLASPRTERLSAPPWWPFWIAFGAALAMRLLWPEIRPLHHDEGVNGWFLFRLLDGYAYEYDPERFHGPFLYFFGAPFALLLGMSETTLRLPVALASSAMVLLLLPLRTRIGRSGVTAAAWLLAVSPSLVYYGRDLIHETYLVALTLALVAAVSRWLESGRLGDEATQGNRDLILGALSLSLMATVKETAALTVVTLAAAAAAAAVSAGMAGGAAEEADWRQRLRAVPARTWKLVALALAVPYILLFTSFFTHPAGLVDSFRAFLPWTEKGFEGSGHEKPWFYFLRLLATFEPVVLAAGALGGAAALLRRNPFGVFCLVWWAGQIALYSLIPYKTPWLAMNMILPLILSAGVLSGEIERRRSAAALRTAVAGLGLLLVAWTGARAVEVSFVRHDDETLGLVYVQTTREIREMLAWIDEARVRSPEGQPVAIRVYNEDRWPLPWYLRNDPGVLYLKKVPYDPDGDVLIFGPGQEPEVRAGLEDWKRYERRVFLLRKGVKLIVYRRGVVDAQGGVGGSVLESAGSPGPVP